MTFIFDIKRFSINDGPGIRTTLFLKGCPLRCVWCHNPEGQDPRPQQLYTRKKCIGCQSCVQACPQHLLTLTPDGLVRQQVGQGGEECLLCGRCTDECPTLALKMSGRQWLMDELMTVVEKERKVMEDSGGGVTLCGGEPLMHPTYTCELLDELGRRGFHRAVDTTLYASEKIIREVAARCELFLVDLKVMDSERHRFFTGVPNEPILSGIRQVAASNVPYWIRIPLIVGVNADEDNLRRSAAFLASLPTPPEVIGLLPYHDIGKGKHEKMGTTYNPQQLPFSAPSEEEQQAAIALFASYGLQAKIGG